MRKANEIAGAIFQWAVYLTLFGLILFTVVQLHGAGFTL